MKSVFCRISNCRTDFGLDFALIVKLAGEVAHYQYRKGYISMTDFKVIAGENYMAQKETV